jgi:hypothetical protein
MDLSLNRLFLLKFISRAGIGLWLAIWPLTVTHAGEIWVSALAQMPLGSGPRELNRTNCVGLMLKAFRSNDMVKALVFMPGATDELYMYRRARAMLTNREPSLMNAISAVTNQTFIRATFRAPFLLLHTEEDILEPEIQETHAAGFGELQSARPLAYVCYNDSDWAAVRSDLKKVLKARIRPAASSKESWHFYRHNLTGWNLSVGEAVQAIALAGRTSVTISRASGWLSGRSRIVFSEDRRSRSAPNLEGYRPTILTR